VPLTLTLQSSPLFDLNSYSIRASAANTSLSGLSITVYEGDTFYRTLTPNTGYAISSVVILMGSNDVTSTVYDSNTGVINIASVTGNVIITAITQALPYDAEVEYLESSGTQYIDTAYYPNTNTIIDAKYMTEAGMSPFSARWTGSKTYDTFGVVSGSDGSTSILFGRYSNSKYKKVNVSLSSPTTLNIGISQIEINETTYSISRATFNSSYPMWLFAMNNMGSIYVAGTSRIYYIRIVDGNATVHDFIPVRKNGVGYLYDKVSGELFGNDGTGIFGIGPDKNS
jgi:hypothetical protein